MKQKVSFIIICNEIEKVKLEQEIDYLSLDK
jgi:hypothetical protein